MKPRKAPPPERFAPGLEGLIVAIDGLKPDPANARKHSTRNLEAIAASLRRFGQMKPIVVGSDGVIRAGNGTVEAARSVGWKRIAAVRSDLPLSELRAYAVADNRTAELAEWDDEILKGILSDPDIGEVGFSDEEIAKLLADLPVEPSAGLIGEKYEIVVECQDEAQQQEVFQRLSGEGLTCRVLTI